MFTAIEAHDKLCCNSEFVKRLITICQRGIYGLSKLHRVARQIGEKMGHTYLAMYVE